MIYTEDTVIPGTEKVRGKRMQRRSNAPAVTALIKISARLAGGQRQDKEDAAVQTRHV